MVEELAARLGVGKGMKREPGLVLALGSTMGLGSGEGLGQRWARSWAVEWASRLDLGMVEE
jgi:hypothetical protein